MSMLKFGKKSSDMANSQVIPTEEAPLQRNLVKPGEENRGAPASAPVLGESSAQTDKRLASV
jgi:hypothetical protein